MITHFRFPLYQILFLRGLISFISTNVVLVNFIAEQHHDHFLINNANRSKKTGSIKQISSLTAGTYKN